MAHLYLIHLWRNLPPLAPGARTFIEYAGAACWLYYLLYRVGEWKDERQDDWRDD